MTLILPACFLDEITARAGGLFRNKPRIIPLSIWLPTPGIRCVIKDEFQSFAPPAEPADADPVSRKLLRF